MQIVTGRRGEPHVTSRQMQAVYRSFLGDFALLDIGEKLRAEAYSNDIVRVYDGVVSVQGIYAVIAYNQYDEVYIEPVSVGKKRIDTIVLHYTKDNALDVEDMQLDVVQGEEYTDNPIAPVVPEGGDAWEGTTDIQVAIYDVEVTNFGLTVTPYARMLNLIPTLESIAERIPETVVTGVKGDSEVLYRDGDVNITKANIGLGNVDNTADTDKPISTATQTALNLKADLVYVNAVVASAYHAGGNLTVAELTSSLLITENMGKVFNMSDSGVTTSDFVEGAGKPIREGDDIGICNRGTEENPIYKFNLLSGFVDLSAYATTSAVNTALAGKVDKVAGKGLSTEDYTTTDKTKLAGISEGATQTIANPADTATETLSKLEVGGVVYDVPQGASGATELSELTDVNLTDVEDNNILQYDETANKWKNSNALQGAKTATGSPITLTDASNTNLIECIATISSSTNSITITVKDTSTNPTVTNTYTIDLGQTVSSGTLDVVKGTLTTGGTTYSLPPTQIKLLKGNNVISSNLSSLSIKYQPDNALGDLLAEAEIGYDKQIEYIKTSLIPSRERNDITNRLQMLPQAVAEQNLEKYGYKIGDYFTGPVANYTYHLADPNTFKGTSTPYCLTQNHLGIVVDTHTTSQWYSGDASSVGYNGSTLHTYLKGTVMDNIKADMIYFFGGTTGLEHLLPHSKLLTTVLANWDWQANQYISALSEIQAIGSTVWSANGYQTGEAAKKLEIFNKYKWTEIFENRYPWLRNMQTALHACCLHHSGIADYDSVTRAYYVVGLINFY